MVATANRAAYRSNDPDRREPIGEANVHIFRGVMVCINAPGYAVPAADNASYSAVYLVADREYDSNATGFNTGRVDRVVGTKETVVSMKAVGADQSWHGEMMYVVDDDTVGRPGDTANQILAGRCVEVVSSTEVMVDFSDQNCCDDLVDSYFAAPLFGT